MSFETERKNLHAFHRWWDKATWQQIGKEINAQLDGASDAARVEIWEGQNDAGQRTIWFTVSDQPTDSKARMALNGPWNNSTPCPPICG